MVENRLVGIKSRGVYETPGGTLLVQALRALETLTLDRDAMHEKERLALRYAELVYYGQWFSPLREALEAFVEKVTETVTGHVTLKLFKGSAIVVGRTSEHSLYSANLASFNMTGYTSHDATGFIRLFGLPTRGRKRLVPPTRGRGGGGRAPPPRALGMSGRRDLWGGRFAEGPAEVLRRLNDSWSFDRALLAEDVLGSIAWAEELGRCGVLTVAEARKIVTGLRDVRTAWEAGEGRDADAEDVHSYVETELARRIGPLAGKLHTGRSRNDQVATDLRLWLRNAFDALPERAPRPRGRRWRGGPPPRPRRRCRATRT